MDRYGEQSVRLLTQHTNVSVLLCNKLEKEKYDEPLTFEQIFVV